MNLIGCGQLGLEIRAFRVLQLVEVPQSSQSSEAVSGPTGQATYDLSLPGVDQQGRGEWGRHQPVGNDPEAVGDLGKVQISRFGFMPHDGDIESSLLHTPDDRALRIAAVEGGKDIFDCTIALNLCCDSAMESVWNERGHEGDITVFVGGCMAEVSARFHDTAAF